ncbi:Na+/H+ antiporter subunit G [Listeria monocytogenes]|nr:Na+/H+ antiporter subunit G [Listeria monocytogenes]EHC6356401.1 Na+/H+ antiporter subunit G [Listeria monocytogenes]
MNVIIEIIISIMILIGGLLSILAAIGVIRLPDVYTRTHAAGISNTFGVSLLLFATVGYFFHSGEGFNARVLLAVLFIFLTTPVASHLINRAAYDTGVPLAIRIRDQLRSVKKDDIKKKKNLIIRQEQIEKARQEREELEERMEWERREDQEEQEREREEQTIEEQSDDSEHEIIEQDESETESDDDKTEK